ncbi:hypothetical protein [Arthrobacter dokdonensis]|uniref:hypothetical protein n=1 Tax=Arthrobacter dokdonellae TaxID=2211210 RepID=UPI001013D00C|nr:hypothetical protein [Arthrobacter dokdonellae]
MSREINLTLARLGSFPMGVEAHRQRIILWEKVFGRGSWHEPIDPDEIYINQAPPHTQASSPESRKTASNLSEQHKEFKFILPGQDGMYSDAYAQVLVKAAESELYQRAMNDGYTIAADSVQVQIIDINEMRQQGHDMQAIGMGESVYLAAHVTGAGARN